MRHAHLLSCRIHDDTPFPDQPVGTGADAVEVPEFVLVELADLDQQLVGRSIDIASEFGDLVAEFFGKEVFRVDGDGVCRHDLPWFNS